MLLYCDNLYQAFGESSSPITVYLDIAKALDTINFNIVLQKLARFGFVERFLNFTASYLVHRQQRAKITDRYSTFSQISSGGTQGSTFALFLFSKKELKFEIKRAIEWSGSNNLNFNFNKFSILEISYKNKYLSSAVIRKRHYCQKRKTNKRPRINFSSSMT